MKRKAKGDEWQERTPADDSKPLVNEGWLAYYRETLGLEEADFETMHQAFLQPLPVGIRLNPGERTLFSLADQKLRASPPDTCFELTPFLPGSWQFDGIDRRAVKKQEQLQPLKQWLHHCELAGALTRQEVVSMIPVIGLEISAGERVLDMCAAPGSKTTQILERLNSNYDERSLVVGNDVDWRRANMLAHQCMRLCSPSLLVTNFDAHYFPGERFAKVLCDVPCSSDGTLRKSPEIWRSWSVDEGMNLHARQLQILMRGLSLCGERLVYSTCSLNPIENEAVVAAALRSCKGEFETSDEIWKQFPTLLGDEGLQTWSVEQIKENRKFRKNSMCPPEEPEIAGQLTRTRRFLPHRMNTGGFFVAVLKRVVASDAVVRTQQAGSFYRALEDERFRVISDFYGLPDSLRGQLVIPKDQDKRITYISKGVSEFLSQAEASLKVVAMGVRAFQLKDGLSWDSPVHLRLTQEGARALYKVMQKRVVRVSRELMVELLSEREVSPPERFAASEGWSTLDDEPGAFVAVWEEFPVACMAFGRSVQVFAEKTYTQAILQILRPAS